MGAALELRVAGGDPGRTTSPPGPPVPTRRRGVVGSPTLGGGALYLPGLLRGEMLQVALDLGQEGVQHVQDGEQQGVVGDGGPPPAQSRGASGHLQELSGTERQSERRGVDGA